MPVNNDMTIEETIEHLDQIAKNQFECADKIDELHCDSTSTRNMASYHKQLAEWLRELQAYRKAENEIEQELVNWNDIDNGKCRGLFLATSIIQHYKNEEVNADV